MIVDDRLSLVLEERARRLARPASAPRAIADVAALLAFDAGSERALLAATAVAEVLTAPRPSFLPGMPIAIEGVVAARGRVLPLVRLDRLLAGVPEQEVAERHGGACIVLAERELAIWADCLHGMQPRSQEPPLPLPHGSPIPLQSVASGMVGDRILIDASRLIEFVTGLVAPGRRQDPPQEGSESANDFPA